MASAVSGMNAASNINRSIVQMGQASKASLSQTVRNLEIVDSKMTNAAQEVISTAIDIKRQATETMGNTINVMA